MMRRMLTAILLLMLVSVSAFAEWPSSIIYDFSEDLACMKKADMYGYIDMYGNWVIEPMFTGLRDSFSEGFVRVQNGSYYEFYDKNGNIAFTSAGYNAAGDVSDGLVWVRKLDTVFRGASQPSFDHYLYGYMDTSGTEAIELQFNSAGDFSDGLAFVQLLPDSETPRNSAPWAVIDTAGTVLYELDTSWDNGRRVSLSPHDSEFVDGYAIVSGNIYNDAGTESYGDVEIIINTAGERMFCVEERGADLSVHNCGDGIFVVCNINNKTYYYLDAAGNELTNEHYSCWYEPDSSEYIKFGFSSVSSSLIFFHDGLALAGIDKKGKISPSYIDVEGNVVIQGSWDDAHEFSEGYAAICVDGKWGYIDTQGNVVVEPQYDNARKFSCGVAIVDIGEEWFIIDTEGNILY